MAIDARTRYTQMVIKNCFVETLKTKPLSKISVTELCEGAQINRSTFYKYYDNPYDLLNKLEDSYLRSLEEKISHVAMDDFNQIFTIVLEDLKENEDYFRTIISENGDSKFRDSVFHLIYQANLRSIQRIFPALTEVQQRWLFYFFGEGFNGMLQQWMNGGMNEPIPDLVAFANSLVVTLNEHLIQHL